MKQYATMQDACNAILKRFAVKMYVMEVKRLRKELTYTLKHNPHNAFAGTASEYMRKYDLKRKLFNEKMKKYSLN